MEVPKELHYEIALNMSLEEIKKSMPELLNEEEFWKLLFKRDFPKSLVSKDYRQWYNQLDKWKKDFRSREGALQVFIETAQQYFREVERICMRKEKRLIHKEDLPGSSKMKLAQMILFQNKTPERLANDYVKRVLPHKKQIYNRDVKFFLENDHLYPDIPQQHVAFFVQLWKNEDGLGFTKEEQEISFEYFEIMLEAIEAWHNWK